MHLVRWCALVPVSLGEGQNPLPDLSHLSQSRVNPGAIPSESSRQRGPGLIDRAQVGKSLTPPKAVLEAGHSGIAAKRAVLQDSTANLEVESGGFEPSSHDPDRVCIEASRTFVQEISQLGCDPESLAAGHHSVDP